MHVLNYLRLWQALGALMVAAVWFLSLVPSETAADLSLINDKLAHGLAYFAQTLWFQWLCPRHRHWRVVAFFFCQGVALEFLQPLLSDRLLDPWDLIANGAGAIAAWPVARSPLGGLLKQVDRLAAGRWRAAPPLDR